MIQGESSIVGTDENPIVQKNLDPNFFVEAMTLMF